MNKIHIFSSPRSGTHYLESLINRMLDIPIVSTPFEERNAFNIDTKELSNKINKFNSIDSLVCKTHPNWLFPYDTSVEQFKYLREPDSDMLPLIQQFTEENDYTLGVIRLNIVDVTLSFALAYHNFRLTGDGTGSFRPPYNNKTFTISMEDFVEYCNKILAIYEVMIAQKEIKCDKIIYYEDLAFDSTDAKLIGITPIHTIESSIKKAKSKKETITNYDELREYAIKFFSRHQWSMKITDGVIKDINLSNLERR
jgi:hypothetical protein